MKSNFLALAATALALGAAPPPAALPGAPQPTVTFRLNSPQNGTVVPAGERIDWRIELAVSTGDNAGLALARTDLVQDPANPEAITLLRGRGNSQAMRPFNRPRGFANPTLVPGESGFGGTPVDGSTRLIQIGGAQNTFGIAPDCLGPAAEICMGQDVDVDAGVGQGAGGVLLALGSFRAPATPGTYTVQLDAMAANTLVTVESAPTPSPVRRAAIEAPLGSLTFSVQ